MADKRFRNIINGESVDAADGSSYDIVNPATGAVYAQAPASGEEDVDRAMKAAETAPHPASGRRRCSRSPMRSSRAPRSS
jgi:acyl-CoA reductase-like NAD-dependent aldehyde dehydrogenase